MAVVKPFTAPEQRRGPDASDVRTRTADGFVMQRSMAWRATSAAAAAMHKLACGGRREGSQSVRPTFMVSFFCLLEQSKCLPRQPGGFKFYTGLAHLV